MNFFLFFLCSERIRWTAKRMRIIVAMFKVAFFQEVKIQILSGSDHRFPRVAWLFTNYDGTTVGCFCTLKSRARTHNQGCKWGEKLSFRKVEVMSNFIDSKTIVGWNICFAEFQSINYKKTLLFSRLFGKHFYLESSPQLASYFILNFSEICIKRSQLVVL